jgi:hypothetical protein
MASSQTFPSGHGFKTWLVDVGFVMDRSNTRSGYFEVLYFPRLFIAPVVHFLDFFLPSPSFMLQDIGCGL